MDETGRKLQEMAQPRNLLEMIPIGILAHRRGVICMANSKAVALLGLLPGSVLGRNLLELVHPDDRPAVVGYHKSLAAEEESPRASCEFRVQESGGQCRWLQLVGKPLPEAGSFMGAVLDVTEDKRRRDALLERERFLESLFESIPQGLSVLDAQMNILHVNPTMERWYSHAVPLQGKKCYQAYHGRTEPCVRCPVKRTLETGEPQREIVPLTGPDGVARGWLDLHSVPFEEVRSGVIKGVMEYVTDITEQRRMEDALRDSREILSKAFRASPDWVAVTKLSDGRYVEVNDAFITGTGYSREEVIGRTPLELGIWPDLAKRDEALRILMEKGRLHDFETAFKTRSGQIRFFSLSAETIEIRGEKCVISISRDITDKKEMEEQLAISQRMDAIGRLAGGVAHDFNNLLTVILGQVDLLLVGLAREDPIRESLEEIRQAAKRAASLTGQLLAFSRRQVLEPRILDLNQVVSDMERMLSRLLGEDVDILTVRDPGLWRVKLDPTQMEQVIMNLAVNSREAMPNGGRLRIETSNRFLDTDFLVRRGWDLQAGPYVTLTVSDTGTGMDEATRRRIFEPFFTTKKKGTGLGLATVYGIVVQSGGQIEVQSAPNKGTSFTLFFPAVEAMELLGSTGEELVGTWSGSQTVLVAEDEDMVRELIRSVLEKHGYTVLTARDGMEALAVDEGHEGPIHLLITDVVMPGLRGQELSQRMRARRAGLRVLYISGYPQEAISSQGPFGEGSRFLPKPFSPDALARTVRQLLEGAR